MARHNQLGKQGEQQAIKFLIDQGYQILETNWRWQKAEIDIIARKQNTLAFIEVKTRSTGFFGSPEEQVTFKKQHLMADAADHYITEHNLTCEARFDIISIINKKGRISLHHIEDAFYPFQ